MNNSTSSEQDKLSGVVHDGKPEGSSCPACGGGDVRTHLTAPDRLHGRKQRYTLLRCDECTLVWLKDAPSPDEMLQHYTEAYNRLISAGGKFSPRRWRERKSTLSQYKTSGSLLDLGCSSGSWLEFIGTGDWTLYGVEMSPAEARTAEERSGAKVFTGTVVQAEFQPDTFDVITCFDVLEHLYDPRHIMERISRWLKPGGIFYVLVPNIQSAEGRVFGTYWHGLELPRHLFHYSPRSLTLLAESVGLQPLSVETHRNAAVGTSLRYVWDDIFSRVGIGQTPVAYRNEPRLPWRICRKIVRISILPVLLALAPAFGEGESIHAVFEKPKEN